MVGPGKSMEGQRPGSGYATECCYDSVHVNDEKVMIGEITHNIRCTSIQ